MKLQIAVLLIFTSAVFAFGQSQEKCFELGALKDKHTFSFAADGGDVSGSYFIEREYDAEQTETYDFSGTRAGNVLTIKFADYAKLEGQPFEISRAVLTLVQTGDAEILKAKFYGKGKTAAVSFLEFESCEPSFAALSKTAKRISFAKGKNSATASLEFKTKRERKAFWLGVRKGQTVSVEAPGCGIAFYYPDKTVYEEGSAIDIFETVSPQAGDYLFVIKPIGETSSCPAVFTITN